MGQLIEQQKQKLKQQKSQLRKAENINHLYRHLIGFFKALVRLCWNYDLDDNRFYDD